MCVVVLLTATKARVGMYSVNALRVILGQIVLIIIQICTYFQKKKLYLHEKYYELIFTSIRIENVRSIRIFKIGSLRLIRFA